MAKSFITTITAHWVWFALLITLAACVYVAAEDEALQEVDEVAQALSVKPVVKDNVSQRVEKKQLGTALVLEKTQGLEQAEVRTLNEQHEKTLFKVLKQPEVIKPVMKADMANFAQPAPPVIPPIPYEYVGKVDDPLKGTVIYLVANDKLYSVAKGEKVDAFWRLDEEFLLSLQFTYLPLNMTSVLLKSPQGN